MNAYFVTVLANASRENVTKDYAGEGVKRVAVVGYSRECILRGPYHRAPVIMSTMTQTATHISRHKVVMAGKGWSRMLRTDDRPVEGDV